MNANNAFSPFLLLIPILFLIHSNAIVLGDTNSSRGNAVHTKLTLFVTTFNVNGKLPEKTEEFGEWIKFEGGRPELLVIGLQEMVPLKNWFVYLDNRSEKRGEKWTDCIGKYLGHHYELVGTSRMVGIFLAIFRKKAESLAKISDFEAAQLATGFWNKIGNKGAVGVSIRLNSRNICFINAHLPAHVENVEKRNQDFHEIMDKMAFKKGLSIGAHDLVIWLGDLNYRLSDSITYDEVTGQIEKGQQRSLFMAYDQLHLERENGNVFVGFQEVPIGFNPTYKYIPKTNAYKHDAISEKMSSKQKENQKPAWCDRILFSVARGVGQHWVQQHSYKAVNNPNFSDHKPVIGEFRLTLKKANPMPMRIKKRVKIHQRKLDGQKGTIALFPF